MNMKDKTEKFLAENIEEYIHDLEIDKDFLNRIWMLMDTHTERILSISKDAIMTVEMHKVEDVINKEFDSK